MTEPLQKIDLSSCDREPIHQLGHVQRFGALIAVTQDWIVAFRSANVGDILGPRQDIAIGDKLKQHFSPDALDLLRDRLSLAERYNVVERARSVDLMRSGKRFDVAIHCSGDYIIIEMEPAALDSALDASSILRPLAERLKRLKTVPELCDEAAQQLKQLLGIDRVMVYRFHPDESGEVVAESRESHLESFLTLRYPKTDIPQQARILYKKNLFRIIADVNEEPVPIEPVSNLSGEPLDLSMSVLRSVSRIHIEYLQNMGVGASLSISIIVDGKLWGLFACHHYSAHEVPAHERALAELYSQFFSIQLEMALMTTSAAVRAEARALHDRLVAQMAEGAPVVESLKTLDGSIGKLIPHDGLSAFIDGEYNARGAAPNEEEFRALVPSLNTSSTSTVVHSDALKEMIPAAAAFEDRVVGALFIPVSRRPRDYIALWRRELQQVVTWAGNPEKVAEVGPNGDRLTPRKSFAAWQQSVSGRSAPFKPEELAVAESLRVTLLEVILRITDEQVQERAKAQERQELLIAELNHRVRNILTLIRGLIGQSKGEAKTIEQFSDIVGGRIKALSMAHDNITRKQWNPASLKEMILEEAEAYLSGKTDRIQITGPDALISPEAYTVLALVVHEMMTNSAKYGALCDSRGQLDIELAFTEHTDLTIVWKESGGPPVKAPERRGFGSTIIERSIPFELKGTADVHYKLSGVEAEFLIPSQHVEPNGEDAPDELFADRKPSAAKLAAQQASDGIDKSGSVLLVEDSMIIAMDVEDVLQQLGFAKVNVASGVSAALSELEREAPQFALLDFNLGSETSEPVARELDRRGIPFWFVTGYGEALESLTDTAARGILQKPYGKPELEQVVKELGG